MNKGQKIKAIAIASENERTKENKGKRRRALAVTGENEQRTQKRSTNSCW
jgi:hypothetical protein